jgi:hypothetical protein
MKTKPNLSWKLAFVVINARPEPTDGTLCNSKLIEVMKSQRHAGELLGFKTLGYTDYKGQPVEGEALVELALRRGCRLAKTP